MKLLLSLKPLLVQKAPFRFFNSLLRWNQLFRPLCPVANTKFLPANQCYNATHLNGAQYFFNNLQQEVWWVGSCQHLSPLSFTYSVYTCVAEMHWLNSAHSIANDLNRTRADGNQRSFSQGKHRRQSPATTPFNNLGSKTGIYIFLQYIVPVTAAKELTMKKITLRPKLEARLWKHIIYLQKDESCAIAAVPSTEAVLLCTRRHLWLGSRETALVTVPRAG